MTHTEGNGKNGYVSWKIFGWAISLLLIAIGWMFTQTAASNTSAEEAKEGVSEIKGDIKVLQNDVSWIRNTLEGKNKPTQSNFNE